MDSALITYILTPIGLGLLGFLEPCSMGTNLLFLKHLENQSTSSKFTAAVVFTLVRGLTIGLLGGVAVIVGRAFVDVQQSFWVVLGSVYLLIGLLFLFGKNGIVSHRIGAGLSRLPGNRSNIGLGLLFAFNIPACAAPLLFVLFGSAIGAETITQGILTMGLFGLSLSLPLVFTVLFSGTARFIERIVSLSKRIPFWTGVVFVGLGMWSIYFGLYIRLEDWSNGFGTG